MAGVDPEVDIFPQGTGTGELRTVAVAGPTNVAAYGVVTLKEIWPILMLV